MTDAWAEIPLVPACIAANSNMPPLPAADAGPAVVKADTRSWGGITARVVEMQGGGRHRCDLRARTPRLIAMLEESGGHAETRLDPNRAEASAYHGSDHLSLFPAGVPVWECAEHIHQLRRVAVDFDVSILASDTGAISTRLMFRDKRIWALASLLADECAAPHALPPAYGESLGVALFHRVVQQPVWQLSSKRGGLTPRQLRQVTERLEQCAADDFHLQDIAATIGLSLSHFCHAFKASTGMPPYRWHLNTRVRRAQKLLADTTDSLADVALASGFADQSHFSRAFRRVTGSSPGQWRRMNT
ncbi:MAG TPA: AraC family transcriptional regulator [Rhizomicrobium sp.]